MCFQTEQHRPEKSAVFEAEKQESEESERMQGSTLGSADLQRARCVGQKKIDTTCLTLLYMLAGCLSVREKKRR